MYPPNITHLVFGADFNQQLGKLPETLKLLELGHSYSLQLTQLPDSLEELNLGFSTDEPPTRYVIAGQNMGIVWVVFRQLTCGTSCARTL